MPISPDDYTRSVHAGTRPEPVTGAIMTPIFQTSTFVQEEPAKHKGYEYSRGENPTRSAYEEALATLEGAIYGLSFSSGLAAEQAIVQLLEVGDHVLVCDDVYGGTGRLFRTLFARYGIDFQFIDMTDVDAVEQAMTPKTKMIWVETPTNPTMKIIDIAAMGKLATSAEAHLVVDNTFATPLFQKPLQLGAHIVVHSTTKYMGGHSDVVGGAVMTSDPKLHEKIKYAQFAAGGVPGPFECFLLLRSIKTLAVRMQQHEKNVHGVADMLVKHNKVEQVFFPGHPSHPQFDLANKQMTGHSGMVSFNYKGDYSEVVRFLKKLKVFQLAESLGGVESLVNHPEKMTHASVPEKLRQELGIGPNLIRLSCGIENTDDLVKDLEQALV